MSLRDGVDAGSAVVVIDCASLRSTATISASASLGNISRPAKVNADASQGWELVKIGLALGMLDIAVGC